MSDAKPLALGGEIWLTGDITQNTWVGARSARALESSLGYGAGRLSAGWAVLLLKQTLKPDDFIFGGLTLRSGGRLGLPADSQAADELRPRVHDEVLREVGPAVYRERQVRALAGISPKGDTRLVKVLPVTRLSGQFAPSTEYPMGGGGLQWKLIKPCRFLVAMMVDENSIARIPGFSAFLGESVQYEDRARLARYLNEA